MRIEFIYTLQGMEVTLFSKRTDEFCQYVETRRQELSKRAL